jgi:hypothetical protein
MLKWMHYEPPNTQVMAAISVTCKNCGNVFHWNDQWPDGLKRCPLCEILLQDHSQASGQQSITGEAGVQGGQGNGCPVAT